MELNSASIHDVIHPTAGYTTTASLQNPPPTENQAADQSEASSWACSQLNPKNRIDSLEYPLNPLWRIDGCTGLGTQYYATPLFLPDVTPMRFDVFIPEEAVDSPVLRELLDLSVAFHTKDATRLRRLGISRHIVRTLRAWVTRKGYGMYSALCQSLPFGSRIILENLHVDIDRIRISVVPTYYVERQLLGLARIGQSLGLPPELVPPAVDISRLSVVQQLHDSVCLVRMKGTGGGAEADKLWILKALASGTKYLFVELRNLLLMEPHPNVVSRPKYLVTKQCRFGGKTAVVGFILPFHQHGSLRDTLPLLRLHGRLSLDLQLRWAVQLASAVCHIRDRGGMFYPDLRLDNILLSASHDVVMVDFEQRGVWCEFSAPEVNAIEYVRILASDEVSEGGRGPNRAIPEETRRLFAAILDRLLPDWNILQACEDYASPRPHDYPNYNIPWLSLDETEQEAAMVYMLGRVLWCIFEGQSAPQTAAVWQSYRHEPDIEFPAFRLTPPKLRVLINHCTRGRRGALSSLIVRRGSRLVLRDQPNSSPEAVLDVARKWWRDEVEFAQRFLKMREERKAIGAWSGNYFQRPKLVDVLAELERLSQVFDTAGNLKPLLTVVATSS
ncbi:84972757-f77d-4ba9-afa7-d4e3b6a47f27 [Thermothielavioides terrestris]|uniref:Protein kinase domain-containing protein n=2 Tax=Thermothielavioides terrestris TaxID=2587410 RepID=G2RE29_THETT|nr:uncharacterized protein THITE_2120928 [Thermothielavioides terrestris NRRL 8126]AEO70056.1 hypothetical protein THITE_2120928 [Thermothielavioides terrestris NRRL 8126]SPQ17854.1 84972757-f77d-4ba9-afa7-d4e3b6a47f27 [Thermothielavioides terrestris]